MNDVRRVLVLGDDPDRTAEVSHRLGLADGILATSNSLDSSRSGDWIDLVVATDYGDRSDGVELLSRVRSLWPRCQAIALVAGEADAEGALAAGFVDYVVLGDRSPRLAVAVRSAIESSRLRLALASAESRYRDLFDRVPLGLFATDRGGVIGAANALLADHLGYHDPGSLVGRSFEGLFADQEDFAVWRDTVERDGGARGYEALMRRGDGGVIWGSLTTVVGRDAAGRVDRFEGSLEDVTQKRWQGEWLAYSAANDTTTGLPNRRTLEKAVRAALADVEHEGGAAAYLLIDLDRFNVVNEIAGHAAGDLVLVGIGQLLRQSLGPDDLLARVGGDEFAVLLPRATVGEAVAIGEQLRRVVGDYRFEADGGRMGVGASVGIVVLGEQTSPEIVMSQADAAANRAKELGRNRVVIFDPSLDDLDRLAEANHVVVLVREALESDGFELHYQPSFDLVTGDLHHQEALLRLRGEDGKLVAPGEFLPQAERCGLMPQITSWVVRRAIHQLASHPNANVLINLPGQRLGDDTLLRVIEEGLVTAGVDPRRLGFEITESTAVRDLDLADTWIRKLKSLGCRFALDDFGSGVSSFAVLRQLPVDQINIDGGFVRMVVNDPVQRAIVRAIRTLGEALGVDVVAEFVESEEIVQVLRDLGVRFGQGYHLGRPGPVLR